MRYILVIVFVFVSVLVKGQTSAYKLENVTLNRKKYYCLISGSDTVMFSADAVKLMGKDQHAIVNGKRYVIKQTVGKGQEFLTSDTLIGTSKSRNYYDVTTPAGRLYDYSYSSVKKAGLTWGYSVDGIKVVTARNYRIGKDRFVEITVLKDDLENAEFIKMMTLSSGANIYSFESKPNVWLIMSVVVAIASFAASAQ